MLICTAIVSGMGFADMMAVNTALPVIQRELAMDAASAMWVAEIYLLFVASLMMMGGALGDRFGRRRVLRIGILAFAAASVLCALSTSETTLIFARATQGLAAALTMPSSLALLNACFSPQRRGKAIGSWTAVSSMMIPLGPLVGGAAVEYLSWQWIFLINLPLCAAALLFLRGVPKPPYEIPDSGSLDIPGIVAVTCGLGALVFGLLEGARRGFGNDLVIISLIAAGVLLPLTLIIEAKSRNPMLPVWLFRRRIFMMTNLQTFLFFSGFQGAMFLLPFFHIQVFGFSALQAGAAGLPIPIAIILLSRPVGHFVDRNGAGPLLAGAPFVVGAGLYLLAQVPADGTFLANILPAMMIIAVGLGLFIAPITTVALNAAGEERTGLASAVNNTMARIAGLISVAMMGVLLTTGFTNHLLPRLSSIGLHDGEMANVIGELQRLGAIIPPETLDTSKANAFRFLIHEAFTNGFHNAVLYAALCLCFAGLIGIFGLRKLTATPDT